MLTHNQSELHQLRSRGSQQIAGTFLMLVCGSVWRFEWAFGMKET